MDITFLCNIQCTDDAANSANIGIAGKTDRGCLELNPNVLGVRARGMGRMMRRGREGCN